MKTNDFKDTPPSEATVPMKIADIYRRFSELLAKPDADDELSLEDTIVRDDTNPYNRG